MALRKAHLKDKMLEALEQHLGIVTPACKAMGINKKTFYEWIKKDPDFAASVEAIKDVSLDFVEYEFMKNIKAGNVAAQIFYLKTKGKNRGYIEQYNYQEIKPLTLNYILPEHEENEKETEIDES